MNWDKSISSVEFIFIGIFLLIYALYIARTLWIAHQLGTSARSVFLKFFVRVGYFTLLIGALLGPSFGKTELEAQATGKDIYLVVDLSKSMDAFDIEPSRLEKVKFELLKNINTLKSNRVGIIIFSSEAFIHSPLTFDQDALKLFIQRLNTKLLDDGGTNLNAVFELINQKFTSNKTSNYRTKVTILITDGEDFGEIDNTNIQKFKKNNINLLILGVGTISGGKIKLETGIKKDKNGNEITSRLNSSFLRKLASSTDGSYFELSDHKNDVSALITTTETLENHKIESKQITVATNKYSYFLILALILLSLDIMITITTIKL